MLSVVRESEIIGGLLRCQRFQEVKCDFSLTVTVSVNQIPFEKLFYPPNMKTDEKDIFAYRRCCSSHCA